MTRTEETASFRSPWSDKEIGILQRLWTDGALSQDVMRALPGRSYAAIACKAYSLKIRRSPKYLSEARSKAQRGILMTRAVRKTA